MFLYLQFIFHMFQLHISYHIYRYIVFLVNISSAEEIRNYVLHIFDNLANHNVL